MIELKLPEKQPPSNRWVVAGAVLLLLMAVGMRLAARSVGAAVQKRPVSIRKPLSQFDKGKLEGFRFVENVQDPATREAGTSEFIDWRLRSADVRNALSACLQVHYYSERGRTPLVPHTPEICCRQQGDQIVEMGGTELTLPSVGSGPTKVAAKYVRLIQSLDATSQELYIIYVFCVNGRFYADRERARLQMAMPWNRALYFCKIECIISVPPGVEPEISLAAGRRLLASALLELLAVHLPGTADLERAG